MRTTVIASAALAIALVAGPSVAAERLTGEAKLSKMLEGRVAGEPRSCINTFSNRESTVIDKTAASIASFCGVAVPCRFT